MKPLTLGPAEREVGEHNTRKRCVYDSLNNIITAETFFHRNILSFSSLIRLGLIMIRQLGLFYTNNKLLALYLRYVYSLPINKILKVT